MGQDARMVGIGWGWGSLGHGQAARTGSLTEKEYKAPSSTSSVSSLLPGLRESKQHSPARDALHA